MKCLLEIGADIKSKETLFKTLPKRKSKALIALKNYQNFNLWLILIAPLKTYKLLFTWKQRNKLIKRTTAQESKTITSYIV